MERQREREGGREEWMCFDFTRFVINFKQYKYNRTKEVKLNFLTINKINFYKLRKHMCKEELVLPPT